MVTVMVPLAAGFEDLEAITITDLLRRGGVVVTTVGLNGARVTGARGTTVLPDVSLSEVSSELFDAIVLPGGLPGADNLRDDPRIIRLLQEHAAHGKLVAAICAAPKVLAEAGLLVGQEATAYPGVLLALKLAKTKISDAAIVKSGNIITSRGPGTAMDFALMLLAELLGNKVKEDVERSLAR